MGKAFKILGVVVALGCTYKIGEVVGTVKGFAKGLDIIKKAIEGTDEFKIVINGDEITVKPKETDDEPNN